MRVWSLNLKNFLEMEATNACYRDEAGFIYCDLEPWCNFQPLAQIREWPSPFVTPPEKRYCAIDCRVHKGKCSIAPPHAVA